MNNIIYKDLHTFTRNELEYLFLSVGWSSGHYPDKLVKAMENYETVYSAWNGDKLVGMICAMDDGIMTAYIHYLLVIPEYQQHGIGRQLMEMVKEKYADYLRILLVAYPDGTGFYESCGFSKSDHAVPMYITDLWT
ncbi:MAG: GNAT family N-acetyltransferase [Bacteroides sp.]|nr:GNAT family N-acetyltransferase [Roseburia sp.]MCM1345559.1 GNAT family N-acetyltransferase [Bacteroides sp.]MCM1420783.1 GNAT family N-acetyltransferase [Bacteroides sp.]